MQRDVNPGQEEVEEVEAREVGGKQRRKEVERDDEGEERLAERIAQSKMSGRQRESHHPRPPPFDWCIHKHNSAVILKTYRISVGSFPSMCILLPGETRGRGGLKQNMEKHVKSKKCASQFQKCGLLHRLNATKTRLRCSSRPRTAIKFTACSTPLKKRLKGSDPHKTFSVLSPSPLSSHLYSSSSQHPHPSYPLL